MPEICVSYIELLYTHLHVLIFTGVSADISTVDATKSCYNVRARQAPADISHVLSWRVVHENACRLFACIMQWFLPSAYGIQGNKSNKTAAGSSVCQSLLTVFFLAILFFVLSFKVQLERNFEWPVLI